MKPTKAQWMPSLIAALAVLAFFGGLTWFIVWNIKQEPSAAEKLAFCEATPLVAEYLDSHDGATVYYKRNFKCVITPTDGPQITFPYGGKRW